MQRCTSSARLLCCEALYPKTCDRWVQNFLGVAQRQRFPAFQELMWHVAVDAAARAQVSAALSPSDLQQRSAAVLEARKQRVSTVADQKVRVPPLRYNMSNDLIVRAGCCLLQLHLFRLYCDECLTSSPLVIQDNDNQRPKPLIIRLQSGREQGTSFMPAQGTDPTPYLGPAQSPVVDGSLRKRQSRKQARPTSAAGEVMEHLEPPPKIRIKLARSSGLTGSGGGGGGGILLPSCTSPQDTTIGVTAAVSGAAADTSAAARLPLQRGGSGVEIAGSMQGQNAVSLPTLSDPGNAEHAGDAAQISNTAVKQDQGPVPSGVLSGALVPILPPSAEEQKVVPEQEGVGSRQGTGLQVPGEGVEGSSSLWSQWAVLLATLRKWLHSSSAAQQLPPHVRDPEVSI